MAKDLFGQEIELDLFGTPKVPFESARTNTGYLLSVSSSTLTADELRSIIDYDPITGIWTWKISQKGNIQRGRQAGNVDKSTGYRRICINHILYRSARLAWFYMTGEWPPVDVDHDNTNRSDDRWSNLRLATDGNNMANANVRRDNTTCHKGVTYYKASGKYVARIRVDGNYIYLGSFEKKEDAAIAYVNAAIKYHGEFTRVQHSPKKDLF